MICNDIYGDCNMAKAGRPFSEDPKSHKISARLDINTGKWFLVCT